ncbi:MAG: hypothetical protein EB150_03930 [Nitrososphaeria archaeon]|nr:hypothetical protein [Nitrososphaeria archaeon]NDB52055.1 hypothetical protein [Nitrosopumilaceae archaeon]NDB87873.1 hypothetical protein [Nitrososphaerota archaeon]NDB46365.1 hypothetical protein [Nitrososphaeria archaeon]NDB90508.1 hypothetical protein [Nitrososphaerota archaeon]
MGILDNLRGFEPKKAKETLDMLLIDRRNEFAELASGMGIPTTATNWEHTILKFCLEFNDCFYIITKLEGPNDDTENSHNKIHQFVTLIRQIARGKTNMIEITHLQNIAHTLAEEFKTIYKRLS